MKLLVASQNLGKVSEIGKILGDLFELVTLEDCQELEAPVEDGLTFRDNARLKADYYYAATRIASLADDSGLVVDALGGAPGVHSARYAATDRERIERLLHEMREVPEDRRSARFVCAMCLRLPGRRVEVEGTVEGAIADRPSGQGGFGYDPIFFYPPLGKTFGQLGQAEKNRVSHRAEALRRLRASLEAQRGAG